MKRAFSLIEILIAIFVLGIGLIMIAGVFPVAVKWTNQDAESTTAQIVAQNALSFLRIKSLYSGSSIPKTIVEQYVPNGGIVGPYSYAISNSDASFAPEPVTSQVSPAYYWTAYAAAPFNGSQNVYIFVFSPPQSDLKFNSYKTSPVVLSSQPYDQGAYGTSYYPQLAMETLQQAVQGTGAADMPIGSFGIDTTTGAVFRRSVNTVTGSFDVSGYAEGYNPKTYADPVIFSPPSIGGDVSPCVYVYATTLPE
jgi:prepilin-type N-terminal cleavage/methylation domain-containing protein